MKVTEHVEHLLRHGKKPKDLVEFGFPKSVVTKVRRQLREERSTQPMVPKGKASAKTRSQTSVASPVEIASIQQKLASLESTLQEVDNLAKALPELAALLAAAGEIGAHRREHCPYQEHDVCSAQTWQSQGEIPQAIGEPVHLENGEPEWFVKPSSFYCAMCTVHLHDHMDAVESGLSGDPLAGAKYRFTCQSCGSKGMVAAAIKCTRCGRQTCLGWFPEK